MGWDDRHQQLVGELNRLSPNTKLFEHFELAVIAMGGTDSAADQGAISPTLIVQN